MSASKLPVYSWNRRVEFAETDAAGIAHFSSFFLYMEQAEHALFRSCGWSVFSHPHTAATSPEDQHSYAEITWPRVHCSCDFRAPSFFEDVLTVDVFIEKLGSKSLTYRHIIRRDVEVIAEGSVVSVCSKRDPDSHKLVGCIIPDPIRIKLCSLIEATSDSSSHL